MNAMDPVTIIKGDSPLILGQPHCGTFVPNDIFSRLNERGRVLADTDWHVDRLYEGLRNDATVVRANFHRYVIDPNRSADGGVLYKDSNTTQLVPLTDFDGNAIWTAAPSEEDIEARISIYHAPYHAAMADEIARARAAHGYAVLFDCHSIRSRIPYLFEGALPDLNVGTNSGASCDPSLEKAVSRACEQSDNYSHVVNGRFKGGWTTRAYGQPYDNVHAIQLELSQALYLAEETAPFTYDETKAARLRDTLTAILDELMRAAAALYE